MFGPLSKGDIVRIRTIDEVPGPITDAPNEPGMIGTVVSEGALMSGVHMLAPGERIPEAQWHYEIQVSFKLMRPRRQSVAIEWLEKVLDVNEAPEY